MMTSLPSRLLAVVLLAALLLSGCNLPMHAPVATAVGVVFPGPSQTPTLTKTAKPTATFTPTHTATLAATDTPLLTVTPTLTATVVLTPTVTNTLPPVETSGPTLTPMPTSTSTVVVVESNISGEAHIIRGRSSPPIGGASVDLYLVSNNAWVAGTRTTASGQFSFPGLLSGKFYLVLVWILKDESGWPCSQDIIPSSGDTDNWYYDDEKTGYYVELRNKGTSGLVVVVSFGNFSVSAEGREKVQVNLICSMLK